MSKRQSPLEEDEVEEDTSLIKMRKAGPSGASSYVATVVEPLPPPFIPIGVVKETTFKAPWAW